METKKLELNKLEAKDGVITIVTRNDEPLEVNNDLPVKIEGTIAAPGNYYEGRKAELKPVIKKSHVVYDYRKLFIQLNAVENNDINQVVKGTLTINPDLKALHINTGGKLAIKELYQLLRMNKFFFADKAQCNAVVERLATTKTSVEKNIEAELNKGGGNQRNVYDVAVRGMEQMSIDLKLPLYVGQQDVNFKVDINIDANTGEVLFWLESIDIMEALKTEAKRIMDEELERFKDSGLVLIEQ